MSTEMSNWRPKGRNRPRLLGLFGVLAALLTAFTLASVTQAPEASAKAGYRICATTQGDNVYFAQIASHFNDKIDCQQTGIILGSGVHRVSGEWMTCEEFTGKYEHGTLGSDPAFNGDICDFKWPGGAWAVYQENVYIDKIGGLNPHELGPIDNNYF